MGTDANGNFINDGTDAFGVPIDVIAPVDVADAGTPPLGSTKGTLSTAFNTGLQIIAPPASIITSAMEYAGIPINKAVDSLGEGITETFNVVAETFSPQAMLAVQTPDQILDMMVKANPEMKELAEIVKGDDVLKESFKSALVKDKSFYDGILEMSKTEGGKEGLKVLTQELKNPEARGKLSNVLMNVAERDDFNFDEFQSETKNLMQEGFFKDILKNPEKIAGMLGSLFDKMGLPGLGDFVAGFFPKIYDAFAAAPGFYKDIIYDENPEAKSFVANNVDPVMQEGRKSIQTFGFN